MLSSHLLVVCMLHVSMLTASQSKPLALWADFGSSGNNAGGRKCTITNDVPCGLSAAEATFIANTFSIVSLEKCFGTFNPDVPSTGIRVPQPNWLQYC